MAPRKQSTPQEPLNGRFRRQLTAEVLEDGASVALGGKTFSAIDLLEGTKNGFKDVFLRWKSDVWQPAQRTVLDDCLPDQASRTRYQLLRDRVQSMSVVAFVGSGMAKPFGYPLWTQFLHGLLAWAEGIDRATLDDILATDGFEDAASRLCSCIHPSHWDEQLLAEFGPPARSVTTVDAAVQWLPILASNTVVTTNYDPVLELVFESTSRPFDRVLAGTEVGRFRDLRTQNKRCLVKIHGDRESPETRVLTREEYEQAYAPNSDGRRELTLLFQNNSLLFLGCSLTSDRTMELLRELKQKDGGMPKHFALMQHPGPDARSELLIRDRFLLERGIHTLWYPHDHDVALEAILGMLALDAGRLE